MDVPFWIGGERHQHPFVTYPVQPIGGFGLDRIVWSWHQSTGSDGYLFDGCTLFPDDLFGIPYWKAPAGFHHSAYWQTPNASPPPLNWGLVSRLVGPYDSVTDDFFWYINPTVPDSNVTPTFTGYPVPDVE